MLMVEGDLWDYYDAGVPVAISTNIGWTRAGLNVMGRGVAAQAAARFPKLSRRYGEYCRERGVSARVIAYCPTRGDTPLFLFPVKLLNTESPNLSWRHPADLDLIAKSATELLQYEPLFRTIALPLVGCGNGGLRRQDVLAVLRNVLESDVFVLVEMHAFLRE